MGRVGRLRGWVDGLGSGVAARGSCLRWRRFVLGFALALSRVVVPAVRGALAGE